MLHEKALNMGRVRRQGTWDCHPQKFCPWKWSRCNSLPSDFTNYFLAQYRHVALEMPKLVVLSVSLSNVTRWRPWRERVSKSFVSMPRLTRHLALLVCFGKKWNLYSQTGSQMPARILSTWLKMVKLSLIPAQRLTNNVRLQPLVSLNWVLQWRILRTIQASCLSETSHSTLISPLSCNACLRSWSVWTLRNPAVPTAYHRRYSRLQHRLLSHPWRS